MTSDEYKAVFQASPDGIVIVDDRGVISDVNPMAETLFGFARSELLGQSIEVLVPERLRGGHRHHRENYTGHPQSRPMGLSLDLRGKRRDGSEFPVEISLSPWHSSQGQRVIATVRDVSRQRRLQDFSAGALRASEEERKRIARELHDDTAQQLSALLLRLRMLDRTGMREEVRRALVDLRDALVEVAEGVRRIARGLRPPELEDAGLVTALRAHLRGVGEAVGLEMELDADEVDRWLEPEARLVLYRIIQEALSNVVQHASASRVRIELHRRDGIVAVEVRDDGRGIRSHATTSGGGLGLIGMQERAVMVGGRVHIESTPGAGTRIRVEVPVTREE